MSYFRYSMREVYYYDDMDVADAIQLCSARREYLSNPDQAAIWCIHFDQIFPSNDLSVGESRLLGYDGAGRLRVLRNNNGR